MVENPTFVPITAPSGWNCWGHDSAVAALQRAVATGPGHAFILGGPKQVGKSTLATEFAKALLCTESPAAGRSCGRCSACRRVARGVHPDVSRFDLPRQALDDKGTGKQTSLTIQTVREVAASLALRPMEGRWRVVVVDDAETMQEAAQEAFLKTLEEPPSYAVVVLLATDPDLLLETIRSRCDVKLLQPVAATTIAQSLVAAGVKAERAERIAELAEGLPGWGFRAANDESLIDERAALFRAAEQWVAAPNYERLVTAVQTADQLSRDRAETFERLSALVAVWRGKMLRSVGIEPKGAFEERADQHSRAPVTDATTAELANAVASVQTCMSDLDANVRPRLALETMVLQWPVLSA